MEVIDLVVALQFQVIFLGTAGSVPTPSRSLPCIAVRRKGELLLFDCGEGAQRQFIRAGIGFPSKFRIFISHLHGDHVLGLPGLLQTMSLLDRSAPLEIYGPKGVFDFIDAVKRTVRFALTFDVRVFEVEEGVVLDEKEYVVEARWACHTVPCLAYAIVEKPRPGTFYPEKAISLGVPRGPLWKRLQMGFSVKLPDGRVVEPTQVLGPPKPGVKVAYSGDTRPCSSVVELARGADLLIHEATFDDSLSVKAAEDGHTTASQAAEIALKAGVKYLALTHISARYEGDVSKILSQASSIFPNVIVAEDFQVLDLYPAFKVSSLAT